MNQEKNKLLKLSNWLFVIMTISIIGSMLLQFLLVHNNEDDGFLINTSGQQRYLSQKITKTNVLLLQNTDSLKNIAYIKSLEADLEKYAHNNDILIANTSSKNISNLLSTIQPDFKIIYNNSKSIIQTKDENLVKQILETEPVFLENMDKIVLQYELENRQEIHQFLYFLAVSTIVLITVLLIFIEKALRPTIIENKKNSEIIEGQNVELSKLNTDKDRFISILAHDLRSPFNSLLGFSDLLLRNLHKYDKQKIEIQLKIINGVAHRTYDLLDQIFIWAKSQSGKLTIEPQQFNFLEITSEVIDSLQDQIAEKNIIINSIQKEETNLSADLNIFKVVMRNLIANAIKFTNENGHINIYAEKNSKKAIITVSDDGVGIEKEVIPKLWEITTSYTTTGTNNETGTGFGLKLCKELIEKQGCQIWVESEVAKGSDFKFTLPLGNDS